MRGYAGVVVTLSRHEFSILMVKNKFEGARTVTASLSDDI